MIEQTATHATLLARVAEGADPGAWPEFCARYGELIRAFCRRQGLQAADVDDIHQEVLLALTRAMPGFRYDPSRGRFRSYLKTVVLHAIYRKSFQRDRVGRLEEVEQATRAGAADAGIDEQWEAEWRKYHLRRALGVLASEFNRSDMTAFEQYALDGRDAREVAAAQSMTMEQVYQAKSRILRRLSQVIQQQVEEEG